MCEKCKGALIAPNGAEIDPCVYEDIEIHRNVNVVVSKCKVCGHIEISWERTPYTMDEYLTDEEYGDAFGEL